MALFSKEDKILIKSLYERKGYNARQFITDRLLVKLRKFGTADRRPGSSRLRSALLMKTSTHALFSVCSLRDD